MVSLTISLIAVLGSLIAGLLLLLFFGNYCKQIGLKPRYFQLRLLMGWSLFWVLELLVADYFPTIPQWMLISATIFFCLLLFFLAWRAAGRFARRRDLHKKLREFGQKKEGGSKEPPSN